MSGSGTAPKLRAAALVAAAALAAVLLAGCTAASGQETRRAAPRRSRAAARPSAAAVTPAPPPAAPTGSGTLSTVEYESRALGRPDSYLIYLPPGYEREARRGRRFPVLYLLHGDGRNGRHTAAHMFVNSGIGSTLSRLVDAGRIRPFIVVMPEATDGTLYSDTEWANTADGAYASAVLELVNSVDASWATIPSRAGRAIAGPSMGGYGAVNLALRHPSLFSVAESWSGYFVQTPTGAYAGASAAALQAASPSDYVASLAPLLARLPLHVLLYGGIGDQLLPQQAPFAAELRALGVQVSAAAFSGPHDYHLWSAHMPLALAFASRWLSAGRS